MKRILIFKNDMLGDFLSLSGCINAIHENYKDSKITLVCSKHNYKIAKNFYFINKFIVLNHKSFLKTIFQNFKDLMLLKYQHIFVLMVRIALLELLILLNHRIEVLYVIGKRKKF